MFAALIFERDPLQYKDLPLGILQWMQSAGGFAAFGLLLWYLLGLPRWKAEERAAVPRWQSSLFVLATLLSVVFWVAGIIAVIASGGFLPQGYSVANILLAVAGGLSLFAAGLPFLVQIRSMRFRRIYALAALSFKEAIRRRVLYAFSFFLLILLFGSWFYTAKPSDEVRTYVSVVFTAMTLLLLFAATVISAFSIPADIKQQTIHTIVTKPVERFEIVLGRFLGFFTLMTLVLLVMTALSLIYIIRGIHPEAASESLKARQPLYGELMFENTDDKGKGVNVGREWEYRSYITKAEPGKAAPTARWNFDNSLDTLAGQKKVRCEYTFDIYRTTKGEEGAGVVCTFKFYTWRYVPGNDQLYREAVKEAALNPSAFINPADTDRVGADGVAKLNELAEKFGYFEVNARRVEDYRTLDFLIPGGLFKNAIQADPEREKELRAKKETKVPIYLRVTCDSVTQYVGMARYDFYYRLDGGTGSDALLFASNFIKGAFGLWLRLGLVVGLAVVLSTYLNGVISAMVTGLLLVGGLCREFIADVATGRNVGGGPLEAFVRLTRRELTGTRFDDSSSIGDQLVAQSDNAFRWLMGRIIDIIPDINRFEFTEYVGEGFNIPGVQLVLGLLMLVGYLLPWFVLAFYLLRWREVASST
jgi:ABC-type transport system involved in multi-copper enzyme maturation permease subunit